MNETIRKLNDAIMEYFEVNKNETFAKPKDIIKYFRKSNGEPYADIRKGLPIRNILRNAEKDKRLNEIIGCDFIQKEKNKYWYFKRLKY